MTPGIAFQQTRGRIGSPTMVVIICIPVSVCHQVSTIGHPVLPYGMVVPHECLGVQGFTDRPDDPQGMQVVLSGHSSPIFMNILIAVGAV